MKKRQPKSAPFLLSAFLSGLALFSPSMASAADSGKSGNNSLAAVLSGNGQWITYTHIANKASNISEVFVQNIATGQIIRASIAPNGGKANGGSNASVLSRGGRFVAFGSGASNLVQGDLNGVTDIFVRDLQTRKTERISVASGGAEANGDSRLAAISPGGRFVAFSSVASNLVQNDGNGAAQDIFIHDRATRQTTRITAGNGIESDGQDEYPAISAGGRIVTFTSDATNLVPKDTNGMPDIFVYERETGRIARISVASGGTQANGPSMISNLSRDGRYVAFTSLASNLVPNDTNGTWDAFVHDRETHQTIRVSIASGGAQGNGASRLPVISGNGRIVAFVSDADNLVRHDKNARSDIFIHHLDTHRTNRLTRAFDGGDANGSSDYPSISDTGRYIAIESYASNLIPGDVDDDHPDIFVADRSRSANSTGAQ